MPAADLGELMSDDHLYRVEITETADHGEQFRVGFSWVVGEPEPYDGDLGQGIYVAPPTLSGPVVHQVIGRGAGDVRATAVAFANRQRLMADGAIAKFADELRSRLA